MGFRWFRHQFLLNTKVLILCLILAKLMFVMRRVINNMFSQYNLMSINGVVIICIN